MMGKYKEVTEGKVGDMQQNKQELKKKAWV